MSNAQQGSPLWWVIPGVLAGMPMPFIHPERRMAAGGALSAFEDEMCALHAAGVRAVVSLLNIPSDASVYESAGFSFLCLPVPDGGAPTFEQADEFEQPKGLLLRHHARYVSWSSMQREFTGVIEPLGAL